MEREPQDVLRKLGRFSIRRTLGSGSMGIVYEALDEERKVLVALKTLKNVAAEDLYRFKREFRSLQDIVHPNLCALLELVEHDGMWFIVMELVSGVDFLTYSGQGVSHEKRLRTALGGIAQGLAAIHGAGKVHRDLKPSNVVVTDQGRAVILDFGLVLEREDTEKDKADIVGTPEYMAPEVLEPTRIGPAADCYSLGVMLYEALTGELPFSGSAMRILLDKQLKTPEPPGKKIPNVPADLDALCMELLQKNPEKRPSATDVLRRLRFDSPWSSDADTPVAVTDYLTQISSFVGRSQELETLKRAFDNTLSGQGATVIVEGVSGVGKTSLVRKFLQEIHGIAPEVVVLSGRCYERESVPFKAFDGIVDATANYLMSRKDEELADLLPHNAALLAKLFPVLNRVGHISKFPPPAHEIVDPHELRRRAFVALRDLLGQLARRVPVVVWIDDMQWTDEDSIRLLREVLEEPQAVPLLLILSSRGSQEGDKPNIDWRTALPGQPLVLKLSALDPYASQLLATKCLAQMLPGSSSISPADIVSETQGHPLYITELVRFYAQSGERQFLRATLDEVILNRIQRLSNYEKRLLMYACVAGAPMRSDFLQRICEIDEAQFSRCVSTLKANKLLRGRGVRKTDALEVYHDRVREAVVSRMLDETLRAAIHRDIGLFLLSEYSERQVESNIFEVVRHLNEGLGPAAVAREKSELFALNLRAGRRARAATAYRSAVEHFSKSIALAHEDSWQSQHETMLSLYVESAEAAYLAGDAALSSSLVNDGLRHVRTETERAQLIHVQVLSLIGQDKGEEAIDLALGMMKRLGVRLPRRPTTLAVLLHALGTMWRLRGRSSFDLLDLPLATDEQIKAARRLIATIGSPAYLSNPKLWAVVIAEAVSLSIKYGQDEISPASFVGYGVINCASLGRYRYGYELGKTSLQMALRFENKSLLPMVTFIFAQFVQHWRDPLGATLQHMLDSHKLATEIGDLVYSAHAAANYCVHAFFSGKNLADLAQELATYLEYLKTIRMDVSLNTVLIYQRGIELLSAPALEGDSTQPMRCWDSDLMQLLTDDGVAVNLFHGHLMSAILRYMDGQYSEALVSIDRAKEYRESALGSYGYAVLPFYDSLIALSCCQEANRKTRAALLKRARKNQRKYKKTAKNCIASHGHKFALIEAEIAKVNRDFGRALSLYGQAIKGARRHHFVQDEALAYELAAQAYSDSADAAGAQRQLKRAHRSYWVWGALAKVRCLEKAHPDALKHD